MMVLSHEMLACPDTPPKNNEQERSQQQETFLAQGEYAEAKEALLISVVPLEVNRTVANGHDRKDHEHIGHVVKIEIGVGVDPDRGHDGKRGDAESHGKWIVAPPPEPAGLDQVIEETESTEWKNR